MVEAVVAVGGREEVEVEKGRESAENEVGEGEGSDVLCWKDVVVVVAARGRVKERRLKGKRLKRRKVEENSLLVRIVTRGYGN